MTQVFPHGRVGNPPCQQKLHIPVVLEFVHWQIDLISNQFPTKAAR